MGASKKLPVRSLFFITAHAETHLPCTRRELGSVWGRDLLKRASSFDVIESACNNSFRCSIVGTGVMLSLGLKRLSSFVQDVTL